MVPEHAQHHLGGRVREGVVAPEDAHQLALALLLLLEPEQAEERDACAALGLLLPGSVGVEREEKGRKGKGRGGKGREGKGREGKGRGG